MSERSQYEEALQRIASSDYNWQEGWPKGALREAAVAQTHGLLAVADELSRRNDQTQAFYIEVLDLLSRITEDPMAGPEEDGSPRSEQPEAAPGCPVCGRPSGGGVCESGTLLTRDQWFSHRTKYFELLRAEGVETDGARQVATSQTAHAYGPCPEESP